MWVVPGATQKYVRNKSAGVRDKTLGLILHVQAGNGELTNWFNTPGSDASSAWQVRKSGQVLQFGDPDVDKFWTQAAGNPDYGAVETEGFPNEPLTAAQIEGVAKIYAAGHKAEGWPFQLAEKPGDRGLGWHGMGGSAWGGHTGCPGDLRKAQRRLILERAKQLAGITAIQPAATPALTEEDDLSAAADEIKDYIGKILVAGYTDGGKPFPGMAKVDIETQRRVTALAAQVSALSAAVKALAESKGADSAAILKAVESATAKALSGLEITLTAKES